MRHPFFPAAAGLLCSLATAAEPPRVELQAGFYRIQAEVAADDKSRATGLMHRRNLPQHQGMLFVFTEAARHCMWMRNTFIPLSVAFLDEEGRIVNIEDMQPQTEDNHCAAKAARYALEMNRGWFAGKGLQPGMRISGIEQISRPR